MLRGGHQGEAWQVKPQYKGQVRKAALRGSARLFAALNSACLVQPKLYSNLQLPGDALQRPNRPLLLQVERVSGGMETAQAE